MEFDGLGVGGVFSLFGVLPHGVFLAIWAATQQALFFGPPFNGVLFVLSVVGVVAFGWGGDWAAPDGSSKPPGREVQ
ncbi:hypothetical protein [Halomarina rubra]|uniref:Uncharacterized protein n=1 Tax=Halomarina rubra TaxID=2071873 RepID=A0ABD6ATF3_9EURY|nr:hypothetical protein [Halomarina rubra]